MLWSLEVELSSVGTDVDVWSWIVRFRDLRSELVLEGGGVGVKSSCGRNSPNVIHFGKGPFRGPLSRGLLVELWGLEVFEKLELISFGLMRMRRFHGRSAGCLLFTILVKLPSDTLLVSFFLAASISSTVKEGGFSWMLLASIELLKEPKVIGLSCLSVRSVVVWMFCWLLLLLGLWVRLQSSWPRLQSSWPGSENIQTLFRLSEEKVTKRIVAWSAIALRIGRWGWHASDQQRLAF